MLGCRPSAAELLVELLDQKPPVRFPGTCVRRGAATTVVPHPESIRPPAATARFSAASGRLLVRNPCRPSALCGAGSSLVALLEAGIYSDPIDNRATDRLSLSLGCLCRSIVYRIGVNRSGVDRIDRAQNDSQSRTNPRFGHTRASHRMA
jgi:hypothetical protein